MSTITSTPTTTATLADLIDLSTPYNRELHKLAAAIEPTREDVICEWSFNAHKYPTLCAYVRKGITTIEGIAITAILLNIGQQERKSARDAAWAAKAAR